VKIWPQECKVDGINVTRSSAVAEKQRCFVSLKSALSHSRSSKIIQFEMGTVSSSRPFHSNNGSTLYHFSAKAIYWSKNIPRALDAHVKGVPVRILPYRLMWKNDDEKKFDDTRSRFDRIPACDGHTDGQTDRNTATA